jgi:hypothetical protein
LLLFGDRVSLFAQANLDHNPILPFPLSLGGTQPQPDFFSVEMGSCKLFASVDINS